MQQIMRFSKKLYDKLVIKVSTIDTKIASNIGLVTETKGSDKQGLEKKIEDVDRKIAQTSELLKRLITTQKLQKLKNEATNVTGLVTNAFLNAKATEIENKISGITSLAIKTALNTKAVEVT